MNEAKVFFDAVCGMKLDQKQVAHTVNYKGRDYHFCSDSCRSKFEQDPEKYASDETKHSKTEHRGGCCH